MAALDGALVNVRYSAVKPADQTKLRTQKLSFMSTKAKQKKVKEAIIRILVAYCEDVVSMIGRMEGG